MMNARETIADAIRKRGVLRVSEASGIHFTRLYAFLKGGGLAPDTCGKLRAAVPEVGGALWLELQAPAPAASACIADVGARVTGST